MVGAAAVILDADSRVLLVQHTYAGLAWGLPGGLSEPGESIVQTVVREVWEETGLDAVPESLTGIYYDPSADLHHLVFRCRADGDRAAVPSSPEIMACGYWPRQGLPRPINTTLIRWLDDALARRAVVLPTELPPAEWLR